MTVFTENTQTVFKQTMTVFKESTTTVPRETMIVFKEITKTVFKETMTVFKESTKTVFKEMMTVLKKKLLRLSLEYQIESHEHRLGWIKNGYELELIRSQELTQISFEAEQAGLKAFNDAKAGIQQ